ncbi:MAG TPA: ABC transporter permease [Vicinamibacteria bacterium]|nr:ABC transporter permease [Vicinamibacteria bacterium]
MLSDFRLAVRQLWKTPGFTLIAVLTLGLGIGANTSAFSIVNEVFFRPSPYPDSGQVDRIYRKTPQNARGGFSTADYLDLRAGMEGYGEIAAYGLTDMSLAEPGEPPQVAAGLRVSTDLFQTLRVEPQLGRGFRPDEAIRGNHQVLLISHKLWKSRFASDPSVVGRTVRVDGEAHEIVGVMPEAIDDWRHLGAFDVFRPLGLTERETTDRNTAWLRLVGRRSRALTREQADAFLANFGQRLAAEHPSLHAGTSWRTLPIVTATAPDYGPGVFAMLIGLSGFVLLIACSNLANLLLARTMARAREFAVRTAIGASRLRLLRPLFAEALLLALAGGLAALYFATWTNAYLRSMGDTGVFVFAVDGRVLAWAFAACLFTALAFGVAPALFTLRLDPNTTLKSGSRGVTGDRGHQRFRSALIVAQFAFAMVLLAGASLFARGIYDANHKDYGWESHRVVTGTMLLPASAYPGGREIAAFERLALERLEALPGVESASLSSNMPFISLAEPRKYLIAGREIPRPGHEPVASTNAVSPRFFKTIETPLLSGRDFAPGDTLDSPRVFIINQAMARGLFGNESPLGRRLARAGSATAEWGEIVGVVGDVQSIYPDRVPVAYQVYEALAQGPLPASEIAVRSNGAAPATLVDGIRRAIASLDADLALRELQPADISINRANFSWQIVGRLLSFLAALGVGLASLGMYGVIARTMAQRTTEFGIRMALGAQIRDITRLVLASGARLAVAGSLIGLVGAFGVSRLIASGFPGMRTDSVAVIAAVTLLLIGIALLASWLPARRAARVDPTTALRAE